MNNVAIGGEVPFKKKYEEFQTDVKKFKETLKKYRQIVREKEDWTNQQSDFWTETNEPFLSHLSDVSEFVDDLHNCLKELNVPEYPDKLY